MTSLREPILPREGDWTVDDLADLPDDGLRYELLDVGSYWLVDPLEPGTTAFDLVDGRFVEVGSAVGDAPLELVHPFPVTVTPALLVA